MYVSSELNATPIPVLAGSVAGFVSFVKVSAERLYMVINGEFECATLMYVSSELNATPFPVFAGSVAGSVSLVNVSAERL